MAPFLDFVPKSRPSAPRFPADSTAQTLWTSEIAIIERQSIIYCNYNVVYCNEYNEDVIDFSSHRPRFPKPVCNGSIYGALYFVSYGAYAFGSSSASHRSNC